MSNLGENPELESRLFCEGCRRGDHGKVLTYDGPEIRRLLDLKEYEFGSQCVHCGVPHEHRSLSELKQQAFEGAVAQSFPDPASPARRPRVVRHEPA